MENSRKQPRPEVIETVRRVLLTQLGAEAHLCVGLSGGLDSVVLLHVMKELSGDRPFRLSAVHVNHQLQGDALHWEQFCRGYCERLEVPLAVERVKVDRARGKSLEASARSARYEAYARQPADCIVLAHHQDDQAETLLIQLLRGAGIRGLSAMPEMRPLNSGIGSPALLRPFLEVPRSVLSAYAKAHALSWVEDPSNQQDQHVRNFLRLEVIPALRRRIPAWSATLSRSARHVAEAAELLDVLAEQDFADYGDIRGIRVEAAEILAPKRLTNLLRWWLRQRGVPACHQAQLDNWLGQVRAAPDRSPELAWGDCRLFRFDGLWQLHRALAGDWPSQRFDFWPSGTSIGIPGAGQLVQNVRLGEGISMDALQSGNFVLQRRQGGERLRPALRSSTRSLRNLFQEARVPPWWRDAVPLVFRNDQLICIPGIAVESRVQARADEFGLQLEWQPFAR